MSLSSCQMGWRCSLMIPLLVCMTLIDFTCGARQVVDRSAVPKAPTWNALREKDAFMKALNVSGKFKEMVFLLQRTSPGKLSGAATIQSFLAAAGITIFIPTDTAFNLLGAATKTKLKTGDFTYLQAVLQFQVVGLRLTGTQLAALKRGSTLSTKYKSQLVQKLQSATSPIIINPIGKSVQSAVVLRDFYLPASGSMAVQGMGTFLLPTYP